MTEAEPAPASKPARVVGLDVARGLLMAYIITIIHGVFWLGLLPRPWASLLLFEMPPVFIITGAAYYFSELGKPRENYFRYLLIRTTRILVPYWGYALVCVIALIALGLPAIPTIISWINPIEAGVGHTRYMLTWHLWFVPIFLAVMALLPWVTRIKVKFRLPLAGWAAVGALAMHIADLIDMTRLGIFQMIVFYALWAMFGFALASNPKRYTTRDYVIVLLLAIAGITLWISLGGAFDMQANKFPPNALFFLFSCAWSAVLLIAAFKVSDTRVHALSQSPLLKPFISAGYSIYLWQGIAYSAAFQILCRQLGAPYIAAWPVAVALAILLGLIASPLERLRLRRK